MYALYVLFSLSLYMYALVLFSLRFHCLYCVWGVYQGKQYTMPRHGYTVLMCGVGEEK